jgi:tetratricopeptide (TPR) repeat protein
LRNNLGILLATQNKPDEAIEQFEKAIAADPKYPWAYFNDAIVLRERGLGKEAEERKAQAERLRPNIAVDVSRKL